MDAPFYYGDDTMLNFESDYIEGAHPKILERLIETNMEKLTGYGHDKYCESAKEKIRNACGAPDADVFFLVGGTQTNATVIDALLSRWQGVVAASTGHIAAHEAGAIEHSSHKVLTLPQHNGKIDADELRAFIDAFYADDNFDHMVFPGMVYISHPTEYGTLYSKAELTGINKVCRDYDIPLFIDGARLGYGLAGMNTDLTLKDIASLCSVFYIGGTKVGALCGEAVVFSGMKAPKHFFTMVKQHGALLAKGRLLGVQFDTLFTDELYMNISRHAVELAEYMRDGLLKAGYRLFIDSPTNQQFIILENSKLQELKKDVSLGYWEKYDDMHTVMRIATSWASKREDVDELLRLLS